MVFYEGLLEFVIEFNICLFYNLENIMYIEGFIFLNF